MNAKESERRDWGFIIFIIPIGILFIFIVGQIAIRIVPQWSLFANMRSGLNPEDEDIKPISIFQPILPQILTPMAWADNFLTPGSSISFPPFIIINPGVTFTPSAQATASAKATPVSTTTAPATATPTSLVVFFPTATPPAGPVRTNTPPPSSTATPSQTATATATATATPTATPTATASGFPSTPPPSGEVPPPPQTGGTPDGNPGDLADGGYFIFPLSVPVTVASLPDMNYELALYEFDNGGFVYLDYVILGISQFADANPYYQLFYWGDNIRDMNSNADFNILPPDPLCITGDECDNREIPLANLHPYPGAGILIDAETAPSLPPPGDYYYVIVLSPPGGSGQPAQIDAIEVIP
ncbi:MAG: hypothetical protein HXY38_09075 [Chloroflexi bacterium]|nr:hypothetical protein [Chloroflexota bacterium]